MQADRLNAEKDDGMAKEHAGVGHVPRTCMGGMVHACFVKLQEDHASYSLGTGRGYTRDAPRAA